MEFKIKLFQFNIKALCLTDFIIAKFWVRIFTVNNFLVTFLLPQVIWWEKIHDLLQSNIVSVWVHYQINEIDNLEWKSYIFSYAVTTFCVPDLDILSNTHLDKIPTGFILKFLFLIPLLALLDLRSWTCLLFMNLMLYLGVM